MKKEQINVPKLRFPKFTASWKQQKFSEFTWSVSKRNKDNLELEPYAVTNDRGFIPQSEAHDDFGYMQDVDRKAYNIVPPKSFAYNPARINVGSIGYYEGTDNVIVSSLYEVFQTADCVDDRFLWQWIKSDIFPRWIEKLQEGSVRLYFYYDKLCECHIQLPPIDEQRLISTFLDKYDTLITLQQRKLDQIKEYKKGMLQKMFPKDGETVPEVRFPGFSGEWVRHNFTDFVEFYSGLTYTPSDVRENGTLVLRSSNVKNGEIVNADNVYVEPSKATSDNVKRGDIIVVVRNGSRALIGKHAMIKESKPDTVIGAFMTGIRSQYSSFVNALLDTRQFEKEVEKNMGATINQITGYMFAQMMFYVPVPEEQRKIGEFFSDIDTLITLHQRKLEAMKEYKKGLLQQMFV